LQAGRIARARLRRWLDEVSIRFRLASRKNPPAAKHRRLRAKFQSASGLQAGRIGSGAVKFTITISFQSASGLQAGRIIMLLLQHPSR